MGWEAAGEDGETGKSRFTIYCMLLWQNPPAQFELAGFWTYRSSAVMVEFCLSKKAQIDVYARFHPPRAAYTTVCTCPIAIYISWSFR